MKWYILSVFSSSKCSLFHNSNVFGSCIIHILYTGCAKIKKNNSGAKRLRIGFTSDTFRNSVRICSREEGYSGDNSLTVYLIPSTSLQEKSIGQHTPDRYTSDRLICLRISKQNTSDRNDKHVFVSNDAF